MNDDDQAELERLRAAMTKLNRLRSNVVMTQNASWSNQMYPLVAILSEAGYELEGATDAQCEEHLACYGGAGRTPSLLDHTPPPESVTMWLRDRHVEMRDHPMSGSVLIHAERWRQQEEEGWTPEHDDEHERGDLLAAGRNYALYAWWQIEGDRCGWTPSMITDIVLDDDGTQGALAWPWDAAWWKPSDDPARNLVKAGALIAAEIDRVQRAQRVSA